MTALPTPWRSRLTRLLACLAISATATGIAAGTAAAGPGSDHLTTDQRLVAGERLVSPNGQYVLTMQSDGNLVEYAPGNRAVWATGTSVRDSIVRLQTDGNLVVIAPGNRPVWSTGTQGTPEATLRVQDDGNVVLYAKGNRAVWSSRSQPTPGGSALGQRVAEIARAEAANTERNVERGGYNCNYYSTTLRVGKPESCSNGWLSQAWCADFVRWVWGQAGARTTGLGSGAISATRYSTYRKGAGTGNARVGDIAYRPAQGSKEAHVGIVVAVNSDGTLDIVSGNAGPDTTRTVLETRRTPSAWRIAGYATPVAR